MAVAIEIDDELTLDTGINFDLDTRATYLDSGEVNTVETFIELRGVVKESSASGVWDDIEELRAQVFAIGPKRVRILLDGTERYDFEPVNCIKSPVILSFRTQPDEGAGLGHWRWEMAIYIKQVGGQVEEGADQPPGLYEFDSSVSVTQVDEVIVRKEWRATAKAESLGVAYTQVSGFGPTPKKGSAVTRTLTRSFEQSRASGVWVWERSRLFDIDEEIMITGGGDVFLEDKRTENQDPNLVQARRVAQRVLVAGTVYGADPALQPPAAHWEETETMKRQRAEEQVFFPKIYDAENGIYARRFEERYIATGGVPGAPNHHGHDVIKKVTPPADGAL